MRRKRLGVKRERFALRKTVQAVRIDELGQGRARLASRGAKRAASLIKRQADSPRRLATARTAFTASGCAVFASWPCRVPKIAPGAVGQVEAFGTSAQVRKMVRAQAAHTTVIQQRGGGRGGRRSGHDGLQVGPLAGARGNCFSGRHNGPGGPIDVAPRVRWPER